jgi:hypothetical protein
VWEGMERVRLLVDGQVRDLLTGLHEVKSKVLRLFREQVCHVYPLPAGEEGAMATGARAMPENVQLPCSMSRQERLSTDSARQSSAVDDRSGCG